MANPKIWSKGSLEGSVAIGIDQSYSGFAMTAIDNDDNYYTEVWKLEGNGVERLEHARRVMYAFMDRFLVNKVALEGYAFGSQKANMAGELGGVVRLTLWDAFSGYYPEARYPLVVPPTSLKKYVTGKGQGVGKSQMILAVYKKWGAEFTDDNAADSYGLARLVRNKHDFEYEIEVYNKLTSQGS